MPCPNCPCAECAKERAKPANGWHLGKHDAYYLTRDGIPVAVVYQRIVGWSWWDFLTIAGHDGYPTREAAQKAAEAAILPANSTPDPEP